MKDTESAKRARDRWAHYTPEQVAQIKAAIKEGMRKYWEKLTEEERKAIGKNVSRAKREKATARKKGVR